MSVFVMASRGRSTIHSTLAPSLTIGMLDVLLVLPVMVLIEMGASSLVAPCGLIIMVWDSLVVMFRMKNLSSMLLLMPDSHVEVHVISTMYPLSESDWLYYQSISNLPPCEIDLCIRIATKTGRAKTGI